MILLKTTDDTRKYELLTQEPKSSDRQSIPSVPTSITRCTRRWRVLAGRRRRVLAVRMAAAALLPVLAIVLAAPFVPDLQAQTERTLVSNTNQPYYLVDFNRVSQPFRTGSNGPGYVLTTVGVRVYNTRTTVENPDVSVRIYSTNASNPAE